MHVTPFVLRGGCDACHTLTTRFKMGYRNNTRSEVNKIAYHRAYTIEIAFEQFSTINVAKRIVRTFSLGINGARARWDQEGVIEPSHGS
jgi:hypothetical protein